MARSVLLVADQLAGIYPVRCVLSGVTGLAVFGPHRLVHELRRRAELGEQSPRVLDDALLRCEVCGLVVGVEQPVDLLGDSTPLVLTSDADLDRDGVGDVERLVDPVADLQAEVVAAGLEIDDARRLAFAEGSSSPGSVIGSVPPRHVSGSRTTRHASRPAVPATASTTDRTHTQLASRCHR